MQSSDTHPDEGFHRGEFCPEKQKGLDELHGYSLQISVTFYIYPMLIHISYESPCIGFFKGRLQRSRGNKHHIFVSYNCGSSKRLKRCIILVSGRKYIPMARRGNSLLTLHQHSHLPTCKYSKGWMTSVFVRYL